MDEARARQLVSALAVGADALNDISRTARRNKKGLNGRGVYADRFHDEVVKVTKVERGLASVLASLPDFESAPLSRHLATVKALAASDGQRDSARRQVRLICETEILPKLEGLSLPTQPASETILAAAVLAKAPTYLQRTLLQANGTYENKWFEASSVMIRKLVENLIIDVYEKHGKQAEIHNKDGDYFSLAGLVTAIMKQSHWPLQRETKKSLPDIKKLGDRAAHNRRYEATRQDVDQVLQGLRAAVDDLLHLAGYK